MKISKRLELIASYADDDSYIIDVGCDHAYLSIYLANTKRNIKILATDIKEGPLKSAKDNISKYGLENIIKLELKDGITNLDKDIDEVIISGMGGILITNILKKKELNNVKTLIISPNNDFELVRKHLNKIGYYIEKEQIVIDNKISYLIIKAKKGNRRCNNLFGKLNKNRIETLYYFSNRMAINRKILKKLPKKYILKRVKLIIENKRIKRYLESK